jgi:hypothetical protein
MRIIRIILVIALIGLCKTIAQAGLQEDFDRAANLESYKGRVRDIDTLEYIRNLTAIIQRENIQIHCCPLKILQERILEFVTFKFW